MQKSLTSQFIVTNRSLCHDNFFKRLQLLLQLPDAKIILREKELSSKEYKMLFNQCMSLSEHSKNKLIIHNQIKLAKQITATTLHLPFATFQENATTLSSFSMIGTSVHSVQEAIQAERLGATYLLAGHVFPTKCKPDLPPRGISVLKEIVHSVTLPVYALGGITPNNLHLLKDTGVVGYAMMSYWMTIPLNTIQQIISTTTIH